MALLNGIHHIATLTANMDRLIAFYEHVFDAHVLVDMEEDGLRHAFIELGPDTVLHPFQVSGIDVPRGSIPVFTRGRLDHFALNVSSEEAFREVRRRVIAAGASDGVVTDMGSLLYLGFTDPDGAELEIIWTKPDVPFDRGLRRAEWTTVEMD
jgi:catechol 2,3-dioxygenase-like lactoylglutathione lyase family enzyme